VGAKMPIIIGNIDYYGVPFPLVLVDRYFNITKTAFGFNLDIFRWDEIAKQHYYEVLYGKPVQENLNDNPNAFVSYKQISTNIFVYKFKVKPGIFEIQGRNNINKEICAKIDKNEIVTMINNEKIATFYKNQVEGPIGLKVYADGSSTLGIGSLPDGMEIKRGFFVKQ
jgi:hypothetical protein